ncbi:MAG: DNA methyltransferase [Bacteroidetes bacterium GWF2_42_66]|nr:MAG: DNA methyltransferase [Bacteroidetes bacterium GWA2_42_15]OFX98164.1 MAG: DNA methyltransferase [Bacteroidetes bacterium GWE2_42_39]OFY42549.1 MAG: DNA methyltransferase [Bacteroidetes bacterium GWF2_42_66]HBL74265.1 DNA methyltransferase [Prolixibacteraceae bacterium]HCU64034.1 DNA methyltransferase [Prolixibacteraceae bacterium]
MKKFSQSPLPFQGQKRKFTKGFTAALANYPNDGVYVDLFGGSGLLSHTVKTVYPMSKVVYNDFDGFSRRLQAIPETNLLLAQLRQILSDYPSDCKITGLHRERVIELLKEADRRGFVDWITLSSSLKFAMNYGTCLTDFTDSTLYNSIRMNDYDATGYLQGVEVVSMDYKELFLKYKAVDKVVFLVDPPYLSTDTATYGSNGYWKLKDYLDVLQVIHNRDYFYFTSNKSQIVELCEWISSVSTTANPFEGAIRTAISTTTSYNSGYVDIMYHYKK